MLAERLPHLDLSAQRLHAVGRDVARLRAPLHDPHDAVIGAMPCPGRIGAGTARLVAPQVLDRHRSAAHRLRLGELAREITDGGGHIGAFGHGGFLLCTSILQRDARHNDVAPTAPLP